MRHRRFGLAVLRLQVQPDAPGAIVAPRARGSRRPHKDATVRDVRRLVENTTLTYGEIAARTGVARASICRWTRDQGWKRPLFAPRATDTVPTARASARLKARMLAARLLALAERHVRELEEAERVDVSKLVAALDVLKMARLAAMGRRRRRRALGEQSTGAEAVRNALKELHRGGVNVDRAPQEAVELGDRRQPAAGGSSGAEAAGEMAVAFESASPSRGRAATQGAIGSMGGCWGDSLIEGHEFEYTTGYVPIDAAMRAA